MTEDTPTASPRRARLERRREDRVLGGVCAAIACSLGVDPLLVRIGAVVFTLISGGTAVLAYLLAWMLIPRENPGSGLSGGQATGTHRVTEPATPPVGTRTASDQPIGCGPRDAWNTAAGELRALASELKPAPAPTRDPAAVKRSPVDAVDSVLTGVGERLRDPTVQASARRTATQVTAAVSASAQAVSHRTRRGAETADAATEGPTNQQAAASSKPGTAERAD